MNPKKIVRLVQSERNVVELSRQKKVAVYARVSTGSAEQKKSLNAQVRYYKKQIESSSSCVLAGVYIDEGITGTSITHRDQFNHMIADCEAGKIDQIVTKSISRFARNTVDTLVVLRKLQSKGISVFFEKENIDILDSKGEFILTLMSSFAQEESRSISENTTWGIRKRFAEGMYSVPFSRFMGYDHGFVINKDQAEVVRRIFELNISGLSTHKIAKKLTDEGTAFLTNCGVWYPNTIHGMLQNEKYKGDALSQKTFTDDFLNHKARKNNGELKQYYVSDGHEAIIEPELFDYTQMLLKKKESIDKGCVGMEYWSGRLICGECGARFGVKNYHCSKENRAWECNNKYKERKCDNIHIYDTYLRIVLNDIQKRFFTSAILDNCNHAVTASIEDPERRSKLLLRLKHYKEFQNCDEPDIAVVIDKMVIQKDMHLQVFFISGRRTSYKIKKFSPKRGIWKKN